MLETLADLILFWIKCYAEESPLCVVFDDAQFVDPFSWKLLGRMLAIERVGDKCVSRGPKGTKDALLLNLACPLNRNRCGDDRNASDISKWISPSKAPATNWSNSCSARSSLGSDVPPAAWDSNLDCMQGGGQQGKSRGRLHSDPACWDASCHMPAHRWALDASV